MRRIRGEVVLPADAPTIEGALLLVEVRDVSLMDVPSVPVAEWRRTDLTVAPGARIAFELDVPEMERGTSLSVRAHVSLDGSGVVRRGDLLTVTVVPVPAVGDVAPVEVPTKVI